MSGRACRCLFGDLGRHRVPQPQSSCLDVQTLPMEEFVDAEDDTEHPYYAVALYERLVNELSIPVAWIELLSPSNKGASLDAQAYRAKRKELLRKGLVFVELDYLHETPPTFARLADYTKQEAGAHAYHIVVLDPRPTMREGHVYLHEFGVDTPMPTAKIPLNGGDILHFDFGMAYRKTFEEALYGYDMDYRYLPMNFDRYSKADQTRIAARMAAVLDAAQQGVDLETGPLPSREMTLAAALAEIESLRDQQK